MLAINGFRQIVIVNINGHDVTLISDFLQTHISTPYPCTAWVTSNFDKLTVKKSVGLKKRDKTIRLAIV